MLKQLAERLQENFPEAAAKLKAKKPLNKTDHTHATLYALGFAEGTKQCCGSQNAYVNINLSCGRVDRLFFVIKSREGSE